MNIIVIGCGKVGSKLAGVLCEMGHDVCVIDRDAETFSSLSPNFTGFTVTGVPIDQDVLKQAGIEGCDAVIAVTSDDNTNIMVSELARELFHVETILTRIYDPSRVNVFSQFDLQTICPTNLTVDAVIAAMESTSENRRISFGTSTVSFRGETVPRGAKGRPLSEAGLVREGETPFAIRHKDGTLELIGCRDVILQEKDIILWARAINPEH